MAEPDPNRRSARAREAVLSATLDLCRETGFARLTIEGIAERAGVSKKTIYRWWPSKGMVLLEASSALAVGTAEFPRTGDLRRDMIRQLLSVVALLSPAETSPIAALIVEAQRDRDLGAAVRAELFDRFVTLFEERMRLAVDEGELSEHIDPSLAMDLFYGPIYHRLVFGLAMPTRAQVTKVVDHVLTGLRRTEA